MSEVSKSNAGKLHSAKEHLTQKQQELASKEDVTEEDLDAELAEHRATKGAGRSLQRSFGFRSHKDVIGALAQKPTQ